MDNEEEDKKPIPKEEEEEEEYFSLPFFTARDKQSPDEFIIFAQGRNDKIYYWNYVKGKFVLYKN